MGGSSSSSNPTTNQTDNRRVIGQGAISAEGSSLSLTSNTTTNVNNTTLDGQVANAAISASSQDLQWSLNHAATIDRQAFDHANSADNNAFSFANSAESKAFSFASKSADQAQASLNTQTSLVANAYNDAKGRGALTDKILIGSIVMAGLVAIAALRHGKAA
jgi:hypothetical protein